MKKSYAVELIGKLYKNTRDPHVETPEEELEGKTFLLGDRSEANIRGNVAVMYEVIGVTNGYYPAHITIYFGSEDEKNEY
jgi:hypothetical protein